MAEYQVGVHLTAHDETGPGTSSASAHLHGVEQSAQEANKQIEGMGPSASRGAAEASVHLNGLKNSLGEITRMAAGFALGGIMSQFGGGLGEVFKSSIDKAQEFNGQVKSLQLVMGGTAEDVSTTVSAFERFGVSSDRAAASLSLFSRQIQKVPIDVQEMAANIDEATGKPLKGFAETMRNMGVSTEDAGGKVRPMMDIFMDTADAFQKMGNGGEAASMAITLFGRAGRDMLPLLMQGKEGIKAAAEEAAKMGLQLTTTNMAQIKAYSNANKDLNEALSGLKLQIGIALMPVLTALAQIGAKLAQLMNENLLPAIKSVSDWIGRMVGNVQDAWKNFTDWLGPLGGVVDLLKEFIAKVIDANGGMENLQVTATTAGISIAAAGASMTLFGIATDVVSGLMDTLSNTFSALDAIIKADPLMTVVFAFALLAAAAFTAYQQVAWFKDIVNALAEALTGDAGAMGVVYDVIKKTFGAGLADWLNPFLNWFMKAIPLVKDVGRAIVVAFTEDKGAIGVVYDVIRKLFGDGVGDFVQPFLQKLMDFIPTLQAVGTWISLAFGAFSRGNISGGLVDLVIAFQKLTGIDLYPLMKAVTDFFDKIGKGDIVGALGPLAPAFLSLKDAFEKIVGSVKTLWPTPLKDIFDKLVDLAQHPPDLGGASKVFDALGLAADGAVGFINGVAGAIDWVVTKVGELTDAIKGDPLLQGVLVGIIGGVAGALFYFAAELVVTTIALWLNLIPLGLWAGALWAASIAAGALALLLNPVLLVAVAIGALAAGLVYAYNTNEDFRNTVNAVWNGMKDWAGWLVGEFAREWGLTVQGFKDLVKNWDEMVAKFKDADFSDVGKAFEALGTMLSNALKDLAFNIGPLHWTATGGWKIDAINPQDFQDAANAAKNAAGGFIQQNTDPNLSGSQSMLHPEVSNASGGWLREPVVGVGPSGTRYVLHANEFVSPAGGLAAQAAAAHGGYGGGGVNLNVSPGAVVINGSGSATSDIAAAADGLWDDLYAKLSRALDNRPLGAGA